MRSAAALLLALSCHAQDFRSPTVVFVCEHGSAKSVIAAAHFNRIAEQRGLRYRAVSRGVHPDTEIPENIKISLLSDGLKVSAWKPTLLSDSDIRRAERVVTLSCELEKSTSIDRTKLVEWQNLPPVGNGYPEARSAIVARIEELFTTLTKVPNK